MLVKAERGEDGLDCFRMEHFIDLRGADIFLDWRLSQSKKMSAPLRKMDKLCKEFPEVMVIRLKSWTEVSKTYVLRKNLLSVQPRYWQNREH